MSTVIRVPIDLRTPEQTGLAGNSFWSVSSGLAQQMGHWSFLGNTSGGSGTGVNVTGGIVYGYVQVPPFVDANSVGSIVLVMGASATSAGLSTWRVGTKEIQTGAIFDFTAWTHENAVDWTAPATAWARKDLSFTMSSATTSNALLAIKIERDTDGTSGTDNTTASVKIFDAYLEITATA